MSLAPIPWRAFIIAVLITAAIAVAGCVPRRAYSMRVELNDRERLELDHLVAQVASRMDCRFSAGQEVWHESPRSQFRVCEPEAVEYSRVVFQWKMEDARFEVSVHEHRPDGPVREELIAYAKETHAVMRELFGNDRISVKMSYWP